MTNARHAEAKRNLPVSRVQVRFVYEGGIKGEWVDLTRALQLWLTPAKGLTVNRVEFNEKERA
jgi:hypothetical protein